MQESETSLRNAPGRSCVACRRRKIKCDREHPCRYCSNLGFECVYLDVKPKEKELPTNDVGQRLERIETMLLQLDAKVSKPQSAGVQNNGDDLPPTSTISEPPGSSRRTVSTRNGKLVPGEGDGKYVTRTFWTNLDEAENMESCNFEQATTTPDSPPFSTTSSFLAGQGSSHPNDARSQQPSEPHPSGERLFALWQIYLENVDPVFKLIHVPTTQRQLRRASQNRIEVPPAFEALMFAICFAAITSIPSSKLCRSLFNQGRNALLRQYRLDFEQALAKANFMSHPNVTTVQALTLFLTCARMSEEKTYVWSMVGLLIRLAMKLGLHRDPADLGLIPFLCEMRRRLWWQIYALDIRTAEESDMNPFICEHSFNTKFPANVNDADLDADMTHHVSGAQGRTEMLFSLVRFHVSFAARMIVFAPDLTADSTQASLSWAERNNMLDELVAKIQDKYLQFCDPQIPICFLTERATRMILTKVKLTMNHPARNNSRACLEIMRDLALRSIEILEGAHMLRTHDKLSGWVWLFEKYVDWDAVAFLLHLTIAAPSAVPLERASAAIGVFFSDWGGRVADMQRWQRLVNLRVKAMAKQSMLASLSTATAAGTGTAAADVLAQVASSTPFEQIGTTGCCLSEAMQSDPAPALDFAYPLNFTSADTTNIGVADMAAGADWNLDNFSFTQGGPSWDMDFDDKVFRFEGPQ